MKKINVGIIGAGNIAEEYIKTLLSNKSISIKSIVGKTKKNSKSLSLKYNIKHYGNRITELLNFNLDLIIIAVDIQNTKNVITQISNFRGIVLIEKPLGINHEETKQIIKILEKNKDNCFVALNRRFYENILYVKKKLDNDKSKKIISVIDQENTINAKKYGHKQKVIDNWMFANSVHLIDLLLYFSNSTVLKITTYKKIIKKEKMIISKIYFKNRSIGIYYSMWNRPGPWSVNISTSKYFYNFSPLEQLEYRNLNNTKKIAKLSVATDFKPGFKNMVNTILNYYKFKKKNKIKKNYMSKYLVSINKYTKLSSIIKKIYF